MLLQPVARRCQSMSVDVSNVSGSVSIIQPMLQWPDFVPYIKSQPRQMLRHVDGADIVAG